MLPNTVADRFWKEGNLTSGLLCVRLITCLLWSLVLLSGTVMFSLSSVGHRGRTEDSLEACREGWRWWRICPQLCARQEKKVQEVEPPTLDGHHSLSKSTSGVFLLAGPTHGPVWEGTW